MSTDYAFWKVVDLNERAIFNNLAEEDATGLIASTDVSSFREELLVRWPELIDYLEPRAFEGEPLLNADKYVLLTLGGSVRHVIEEALGMARRFDLVVFSGMDGGLV